MAEKWKIGDLGRFLIEDPKRPRFEVLGAKPEKGVAVWYGGNPKPVWIPEDVFRSKCVSFWNIEVVPPLLPWIARKGRFQINDERAAKVTQAVITDGYFRKISQVDVQGHTLTIRNMRFDHASCMDEDTNTLVMVPLKIIAQFGVQIVSKWDRLQNHDPFGEDLDEIDLLLQRNL